VAGANLPPCCLHSWMKPSVVYFTPSTRIPT
jgi:hypothetical protein